MPYGFIRFRALAEAMTNHRVMQQLRDLTDEDTVRALVDPQGT